MKKTIAIFLTFIVLFGATGITSYASDDNDLDEGRVTVQPDIGGQGQTIVGGTILNPNNDGSSGGGGGGTGGGGGGFLPVTPGPGPRPHIPIGSKSRVLRAYVSGYPDRTFRPNNSITRAEMAMMLYRLLDNSALRAPRPAPFSDMQTDAWWYTAVSYLTWIGVITGYPDGTFRPDNPITRAEFLTLMTKFMDVEPSFANSPFPDLSRDHWGYGFVMAGVLEGWIVGYPDGTFRPNAFLTRAEAVTIINHATERDLYPHLVAGLRSFTDVGPEHWAFTNIELAANDLHITELLSRD